MATTELSVRLKSAVKTSAEWTSLNPVLLKGEVAYTSDYGYRYKVGDGSSKWSALPYNTMTSYGVATSSSLGLVKSGTDITVDSSGNVSVNDDSHNHVISNVDGLQGALDNKAASGHTHDDRYYTESEINTKLSSKSDTSHTHNLSTMINTLTVGESTPVDADYYVSQSVGGGTTTTTYHRRPMSALWAYIKSKLANVAVSGSYNDLSNKPTIPTVGNGTITVMQNGTTKGTFTTNQSGNTTIALSDTNTNTTYTAGRGLALSGTSFKLQDTCTTITDWNSATTTGWYMGTSASNAPVSSVWLYGEVIAHNTNYVRQILYRFAADANVSGTNCDKYERVQHNGTWGSWVNTSVRIAVPSDAKFTDTNTWRGVQDNLTSSSTSDSLSANQGRLLANGGARDSTKLPLAGGTMTGQLKSTYSGLNTIVGSGATDIGIEVSNSGGSSISLMIGSGKVNHGLYSKTLNKWMVYADSSNIYLNGNASTASKLATARTISLTGSVTGSVSFDGSGNISISTTTNHTHNYAGSSSAGGDANNALKLSGYSANSSATANTIALRNSSGHLLATYFNQSSSAETPTTSSYIMYANSDGYLRKSSLANIKSILGLGSSAYTASSAYATAGHTHNYAGSSSAGGAATSALSSTIATTLARSGNTSYPMTFNWDGRSGQPTWLWGGNDGVNMYIYNPSNFNVNYAVMTDSVKMFNNDTNGGVYHLTFASGATNGTYYNVNANSSLQYHNYTGTTSDIGSANLIIGNNIASGTAENKYGMLRLYSTSSGCGDLRQEASTSNFTNYLPASSGTLLNTANYSSYALPLSGGTVNGNIQAFNSAPSISVSNGSRVGSIHMSAVSNYGLYDITNDKWILRSDSSQNIYIGSYSLSYLANKQDSLYCGGLPEGTSLDTLTSNAVYTLASANFSGTSPVQYGTLLVFSSSYAYVTQIVISATSQNLYWRHRSETGIWSHWYYASGTAKTSNFA